VTQFEFAPHVLWSNGLSHEICSRSVDRLIHRNVDFNDVLEENTGSWTDDTFTGWESIYWDDYRPDATNDPGDDQSKRRYDVDLRRIKDVYSNSYSHSSIWGSEGITFDDPNQGALGDCWMIAASSVVS
jgi:hypothetical protein